MIAMKLKNNKLQKWLSHQHKAIFMREDTFIGHQKQMVLLYYTLFFSLTLITNILGIAGPPGSFSLYLNIICLVVELLVFFGYFFHRISLNLSLMLLMLFSTLIKSSEILYYALTPSEYGLMLILTYTTLLSTNVIFSLVVLLRYFSIILSLIILGVYLTTFFITGEEALLTFFPIFLMAFFTFSLLGYRLLDNINKLSIENTSLKNDEREFLFIFKMKKEQIKAYSKLANREHPAAKMEELFDLLNETTQRNIVANITNYLQKKETDLSAIEACFPELTPSERDICRLILQDKKLGEICTILDKTETNINSQRAHIRKKLGLQTADNLQNALKQRMKKNSK